MYAQNRLDTPPPRSQFRRPWSPDPYDPLPRTTNLNGVVDDYFGQDENQNFNQNPQYQRQQRREPSDVSVEALDLADYARTLPQRTVDPYPAFYPHDIYTPAPTPLRPLVSRDSLHPPSLISRGGTATASTQSHPSSRTSHTSRRPFSLPPPARHPGHIYNNSNNNINFPTEPQVAQSEVDISQFPSWSRGWYDSKGINAPPYFTPTKPLYDPTQSPFDPTYDPNNHNNPYPFHQSDPYALSSNVSNRDLLPWNSDPTEFGPSVDPETKEERLRMLQREFGVRNGGGGGYDPNEQPRVGSVNANGKLVTEGPKKRIATRLMQVVLSLTAAIPSIYAAIVRTIHYSLIFNC